MDTLEVMKKAEKRGGTERREALEQIFIEARKMGCDMQVGGGRAGGMNIRYGSIGYAVLDINTHGVVKVYASPHPGKEPTDAHRESVNDYLEASEELTAKSFPVNSYGHLEDPVEEIEVAEIVGFIEHAVDLIQEHYYRPWDELHDVA